MQPLRPQVLLHTHLETFYNREILHGITAYARQHTNWQLLCRGNLSRPEQRRMRLAGVLVTGVESFIIRLAREEGIPLVVIGDPTGDLRDSVVSVDERGVGAMASEYFASLGLKHLAYVAHGSWPFVRFRLEGFVQAAASRGYSPVHQFIGDFYDRRRRPRFERDLAAMLRGLPRPCGLLAANDTLGAMIVQSCRNIALRVPDDIAVVGVDDDELACEQSDVPLSSVEQPLSSIGYEAARLLHEHMDNPALPPTQLRLPPLRVVARASSDLIALEDEDVVSALRLISYHLAEPINVAWVVKQLPVARRSLYRKFKALVGRTILEQIHHVRFQKAKELLAESDLSLELVAQRSGFANARWMADSFRRKLAITPTRFRRQFRTES